MNHLYEANIITIVKSGAINIHVFFYFLVIFF